jgi:hypothetical protein
MHEEGVPLRNGDDQAARGRQVRFELVQSFAGCTVRRSCVNALSEALQLEIWQRRDLRTRVRQRIPKGPLTQTGKPARRPDKITFKPDTSIMDASSSISTRCSGCASWRF